MESKHDTFTWAYIEAALFSSTLAPYKECASCGRDAVMCQFDKDGEGPQWTLCSECGGDAGGNSYEPPADDNYSVSDISEELMARIVRDCAKFQDENDLSESGDSRAGRDFWLTRCGHGCGFWDGDWPETGEVLTKEAKAFGNVDLYVGDDGLIYSI
jgi:hypothetical protein